ncbi:hypothetical protein [Photobacterium leiognathi]|uniref:hypothetical protein n=1 Tax=Photobacterium leiognathi TaxID=553611 RepID=UPI002980AD52|nr:hypothetical protein [Photobacterium leiognathi]
MFKHLLGKIFLTAEAREIGESFERHDIKGAEVVGRGTIVVDGKTIASSQEFIRLKEQAQKIINSREQQPTHQ